MQCPYCVSELPVTALACPNCARDLYLFKPLLQKLENLEAALAAQQSAISAAVEERIVKLESHIAGLVGPGSLPKTDDLPQEPVQEPLQQPVRTPRSMIASLAATQLPMLISLVGAHAVLLFVYDTRPLYLRIASMLIPLPFGFALFKWHPKHVRISAAAGFISAALAVALMLLVTSIIDGVAFLPANQREFREVLEYMASIGLAFVTGLLLAKLYFRPKRVLPGKLAHVVAKAFSSNDEGVTGIERLAIRLQKVATAISPLVAAGASIYAGIKAIMAN